MIKKACTYCLLLLLVVALFSCTKELALPDVEKERKIALIGELVAGEPIYIRTGQSVPVSAASSLRFEVLRGLSVNVSDGAGTTINLSGQEDSLTQYLYTIPYTSASPVSAGSTYTVTATHSELGTATATVSVPKAFTAHIGDTASTLYAGDSTLAVDVVINDEPGQHYYVIEALKQPLNITAYFLYKNQWLDISSYRPVYDSLRNAGITPQQKYDTVFTATFFRQQVYTDDANTENIKDNSSFNPFRRVLLGDYRFDGSAYTTRVYVSKLASALDAFGTKGRIILQVRSVSKEYFDHLKAYEMYDPEIGFSTTTPRAEVKSSVQNGMGVIGGAYRLQFYYVLDSWDF